jgi:hypothetical protein
MDLASGLTASGGTRHHTKEKTPMIERIELTQDRYLEAMHLLDFTPEQIEENRRHHGGSLFLSEDVAVACLLDGGVFGVGLSVCPTTGEMILSQVAQDLVALMQAFDDLVNEAYAKFNDPLHNPDHVSAMMDFRAFLSGRAEEISADLAPPGRTCDPAF